MTDLPDGATPLDPDEMEGLKHSHVETRGELNQLEQANIHEGLLWLKNQKTVSALSEDFVRKLHKQLFGDIWEWAGYFRQSDKNIGVDWLQIPIHLRQLLDDATYWVENNTYSVNELAARFHHRLVWIHLFPNGNGRHARILTDALLEKQLSVNGVNWGSDLLDIQGEVRTQYISALREADANNYESLIQLITKGRE